MLSMSPMHIFKKSILTYYICENGLRRKFRDYLKASATTYLEFANNKKRYFMKWLEAAKVSTFTNLVNLILVEELLRRVPNPIRLYLADKEENDFIRCAQLADSYSLVQRVPADTPSSKTSWFIPEKTPVLQNSLRQPWRYGGKVRSEDLEGHSCSSVHSSEISCTQRHLHRRNCSHHGPNCYYTISLARVRMDYPFMQGEVQIAIWEKRFPMSGVQLLLGNDLAEDQQHANVIIKEDPQVCDSAVENPVLQLVEEVQSKDSDNVFPPVMVTKRATAARLKPAAAVVPQDPPSLPPNLRVLEFHKLQREDPSLTSLFL
ncbi:uncharacterized protein [Procambarus clarkii]|uniref:uncharacterized protein n=1 Tax=Procambarus clarkii TaxID=6728 RepID=UPI003742A9F8